MRNKAYPIKNFLLKNNSGEIDIIPGSTNKKTPEHFVKQRNFILKRYNLQACNEAVYLRRFI